MVITWLLIPVSCIDTDTATDTATATASDSDIIDSEMMKNYNYNDWMKEHQSGQIHEVTCTNIDGSQSNVVVTAGSKLRQFFRRHKEEMVRVTSPDSHDKKTQWAINLGATSEEAEILTTIQNPNKIWDYVLALLNKAGVLKFQPWIARDVGLFLNSFDMPLNDGQLYSAIHVRRGDKLVFEARDEVERYWKSQGHTDMNNLPTDYVPFAHYLSQWDGPETCVTNDQGVVEVKKHNVYIATDDPIVVKQEIADLKAQHLNDNTILWNNCFELTFYFNPTDASAFHLNGDGEHGFDTAEDVDDSCFARYHRNIASIADMIILSKARTFIGEFNSNWGRLIRTVRVRLDKNGLDSNTHILDTRVAWGPTDVQEYVTLAGKEYQATSNAQQPIDAVLAEQPTKVTTPDDISDTKNVATGDNDMPPLSVCDRLAPIPYEKEMMIKLKYDTDCSTNNRKPPEETTLLLLEGLQTFGRTGEFLFGRINSPSQIFCIMTLYLRPSSAKKKYSFRQ